MKQFLSVLSLVVILPACSGDGSDLGPTLAELPKASSKLVVLDDQGRGVAEATVTVVGTSLSAITGRNGRGDLLASPAGRLRLRIDGAAAGAVDGDELGTLIVALSASGGDLPGPFHLPDVQGSTGGLLPVGTQTATTVVDDSATSGARLTITSGSSLGLANGAADVTVRTASLQPQHLPGDLPTVAGQATLLGRGIYIDPPSLTFTPAADLEVPDDLVLGGGTASLFHLDGDSGEWVTVASGITASGGLLTAPTAVATGGLYAFGVTVAAGQVAGRVVDAGTTPVALRGMLVNVDGQLTTTGSDGRFLVDGVAATTADAVARTAQVAVFAGGDWLPVRATATATMSGSATIDIGDLALDTVPAGNLRFQMITRGRAESKRRSAVSTLFGNVALVTTSDVRGQALFEDVPAQWFGFQDAHGKDRAHIFYAQGLGRLEGGRRWRDVFEYFGERSWYIASGRARVLATDAVGGGPLYDVALITGGPTNQRLLGRTRESGALFADRSLGGRITASHRSARDGRSIVHAFSIDRPSGEHVELPLRQVLRTPQGAFDRHGIVAGELVGADAGREHRLRATRRLELQEWWEDAAEGTSLPSALPIDVDPATTHAAFRAGVASSGGHLVAAELHSAGGITTLDRLGVLADIEPTEGAVLARNLPLDLAATTTFTSPGAVTGLHAGIAVADLTVALALEQPSGRGIDVVRGIGGNHTAVGDDLQLLLPPLAGQLAGHRWFALVQGEGSEGPDQIRQLSLLRLSGQSPEATVPMLAVPTVTAPANGATVSAAGFTVQFTLPAGALYATIELHSQVGGDVALWQVLLPPTAAEFTFTALPTGVDTPLVAGRSYTLTVSACRALAGPLAGTSRSYSKITGLVQSIGALERGIDAIASRTIQVTAN